MEKIWISYCFLFSRLPFLKCQLRPTPSARVDLNNIVEFYFCAIGRCIIELSLMMMTAPFGNDFNCLNNYSYLPPRITKACHSTQFCKSL